MGGGGSGGGDNPFDTGPAPRPATRNANANAANAPANAPGTTTYRQHRVIDKQGFEQPMVAATVLVPTDWNVEGGLEWLPQLTNMSIAFDLKLTAPDGRQARFLPSFSFEFGNAQQNQQFQKMTPTGNGNLFFPIPETPGAWVADMVRLFPAPGITDHRVVHEAPIPELTRQLQQQAAPIMQMIEQNNLRVRQMQAQYGIGYSFLTHYDTQAWIVVSQYKENGKAFDETLIISWSASINYLNGEMSGGHWAISEMRSARGPAGTNYLADPQLATIFQSLQPAPQWSARMQQHWAKIAQIRQKGADDRNDSWREHNAKMQQIRSETSSIINDGWAARQEVNSRNAERFTDTITDVQAYETPDGEKVKLSSFYDDAYTNGHGEYILSNDPSFNAENNPHLNGNWQRLKQIP